MSAGAPTGKGRVFLFLQGPHGPFFGGLGRMLRRAGATTWRVGFNRGDQVFWPEAESYIPHTTGPDSWPDRCAQIMTEKSVTDLVLYGDVRPIHAGAIALAQERGITVHVFEEGYLRPYWITYERGGSNGNSALMRTGVARMRASLGDVDVEQVEAPAHWGAMRQHIFYGALYHAFLLLANRRYRGFRPHRMLDVRAEFRLYLRRLLLAPFLWADRRIATRAIEAGGFPYHLALLQLEHDANFQRHSPFSTTREFLETLIRAFADGAPPHHHLVVKAHPLEDGRSDERATLKRLARAAGIGDRVHYVRGGKLARLLDHANSAVTVNSTAAQQALWRGLPLKVFGSAVYAKPEFVSNQPLVEFFGHPLRPDLAAYRDYRLYLLETSQLPGSYYSTSGRKQVLRQIVDLMLSPDDPYEALQSRTATPTQHLHLVNR